MYELSIYEGVIAVLFVSHVLEVYHHGSIFESFHAKREAGAYTKPGSFFDRLLACRFCLSVWVTGVVIFLVMTGRLLSFLQPELGRCYTILLSFFLTVGALTRASNILHDLVRPFSRTPNSRARQENAKEIRLRQQRLDDAEEDYE